MNIEPKIAIACRNRTEIDVTLRILEQADIPWYAGSKATQAYFINDTDVCRIYIMPPDEDEDHAYLLHNSDPEDTEFDDEDGFEWTYVEASDMFRNHIIAERRKHAST